MNYSQVSYGSNGNDVKTLQEMLNRNGYSLDVDGNFGPKTQEAVKDYQKKNNLSVDGIAGKNTWGALTGGGAKKTATPTSAADMQFSYDDYTESDAVKEANALLASYTANKPGDFSYSKQDQLSAIMDQYMNRDKFSYDLNSDALYQQYADQYATQGKLAMMDTMGQAAAMTGGYGNSYAQTVGQQTYQGYLQQLNDVVPELYQMALNQYNQEGDAMLNQYGLLSSDRDYEYGTYRDQVSDYYAELDRRTDNARYLSETEYGKYIDDRAFEYGKYSDDKSYAYQAERDAVADKQYNEQWEWEKSKYERAQSSGGSGGKNSGSKGDTGESGIDLEHVATMSSESIVTAMSNYNAAEDDNGLAAFLDDLVATGRITEATADQWYRQYKTQKDDDPTDVTVPTKPKGMGGGGGGRFAMNLIKN